MSTISFFTCSCYHWTFRLFPHFWLMWIMLQWIWGCRYLFEILFSFLLGMCPEMELLNHIADPLWSVTYSNHCGKQPEGVSVHLTPSVCCSAKPYGQLSSPAVLLYKGTPRVEILPQWFLSSFLIHGLQPNSPSCNSVNTYGGSERRIFAWMCNGVRLWWL